jgi:hypothetical protein
VPWRFSDAGRQSVWLERRRRRPKTCTEADKAVNLFARTDRDHNLIGCDTTELQDEWLPIDF